MTDRKPKVGDRVEVHYTGKIIYHDKGGSETFTVQADNDKSGYYARSIHEDQLRILPPKAKRGDFATVENTKDLPEGSLLEADHNGRVLRKDANDLWWPADHRQHWISFNELVYENEWKIARIGYDWTTESVE